MPDRFLRSWDPVTVFFDRDLGPSGGGPETEPQRYVHMSPAHPGAFRWLDGRTLQFRPAEPWPPLARFQWEAFVAPGGRSATRVDLATLMLTPSVTQPEDGAVGLGPVESVLLQFPEPIEAAALARALRLELRPAPGIDAGQSRWLGPEQMRVKALSGDSDVGHRYLVDLEHPIGPGLRAVLHFRLSLDDDRDSFHRLSFRTAEAFRAIALGCRSGRYPLAAQGSVYPPQQAIRCEGDQTAVLVELNAEPEEAGPVLGRNLLRFSPAVPELSLEVEGRRLVARGRFARDTVYRVELGPAPLRDTRGRALQLEAPSAVHLYFPSQPPYLRWAAAHGIAERLGPQRVPVEGRGDNRLDLRIHAIEPLDRSFWPFPEEAVVVDEEWPPAGPGEEPLPHQDPLNSIDTEGLAAHIAQLGSPPISTLVQLPLDRSGQAARFGLDLQPYLSQLAGEGKAGSYLVGMRRLEGSRHRQWMRLQVSDLALTTVEEAQRVVFVVSSQSTAQAVPGAAVRVEGWVRPRGGEGRWQLLWEGVTDGDGRATWRPRPLGSGRGEVRRLVVAKGEDLLVLDARRAPDSFADNHFHASRGTWLQWTLEQDPEQRGAQAEDLAHLFSERPVYRPEEPVHVKGYLRRRHQGRLEPITPSGFLVVEGPGGLSWRYPVQPTERGSFYHRFLEENLPAGEYRAVFETAQQRRLGSVSFRKEAYRLPRFEVQIFGPERATLDRELDLRLTATYYAGGRVADRPVRWNVTQFPYTWRPKAKAGFVFSSDGRFSRTGPFEATPDLEREDRTDDEGSALITLDPSLEPTAQPRTYVVEATVTGADDQTVTSVRSVVALPPFLLGLKVPRLLQDADEVRPEILVLGPDEQPLAGQEVTVRLLHRQWHSHLRASDFTDGVARYVTDVVDEELASTTVISAEQALAVPFELAEPGVYVIEVASRDRLGRSQVVAVDLFAAGDGAVAWEKPSSAVFRVRPDQSSYEPGEVASLVLESPFQRAEALAMIEAPDGVQYRWLAVRGGQAVLQVPISGQHTPRLPVHILLFRGRLEGTAPSAGNNTDLGKPVTLGNTTWLEVDPVEHRLKVELSHPSRSLPGREIEVEVRLADNQGRPRSGEVTLWLVDQAVLALGREQRLDPVPDFLTPVRSYLIAKDTRGLSFGLLPFAEMPGGGEGAQEQRSLFDRQTVRRNFQPVPFYDPSIEVGEDGLARVRVSLPDNLTNFELRAKAVSGPGRFGFARGRLAVRLPVIVQPALPRFLRPGDRFTAAAIGRLVEGEGGAGRAQASVEGLEMEGEAQRDLAWVPDRPERLEFPLRVPESSGDGGQEAVVRVAVERLEDGAGDAFEVRLPIRPDRQPVQLRELLQLDPDTDQTLMQAREAPRPGSIKRRLVLSGHPALLRLASGLDMLLAYPYGCTEQRLARARGLLAYAGLARKLEGAENGMAGGLMPPTGQESLSQRLNRSMADLEQWLTQVVGEEGLAAYWPGGQGNVALSAWVLELLAQARDAGLALGAELEPRLVRALEASLRSDYAGQLVAGGWEERSWALQALAAAGRYDGAYAAELAQRAQTLDLESRAGVLLALQRGQAEGQAVRAQLADSLWQGLVFRSFQGREIFAGLAEDRRGDPQLLPSEVRTVSRVLRALSNAQTRAGSTGAGEDPRLALLIDGLVGLGGRQGWGSTQADAAAMEALAAVLRPPLSGLEPARVQLSIADAEQSAEPSAELPAEPPAMTTHDQWVELGPQQPLAQRQFSQRGESTVVARLTEGEGPALLLSELSYVPAADGSQAAPQAAGFVVERELLIGRSSPRPLLLREAGTEVDLTVGEVVEEHLRLVNPEDRHYVALIVPLAAGMEPLNPSLETAPPEAQPAGRNSLQPTYVDMRDDHVAFYFDSLPKGSYDFYFRTRASVAGNFVQPPAQAEMMYDRGVSGRTAGARVLVQSAVE